MTFDPQEALRREVEIAKQAARLRWLNDRASDGDVAFEHGARAGLTARQECYEFAQYVANLDPDDIATDCIEELVGWAQAAVESAS